MFGKNFEINLGEPISRQLATEKKQLTDRTCM